MPYKDPQKRKEYHKVYQKKWYARNKKQRRQQIYDRKKKIKEWYKEYKKDKVCSHCGFNNPVAIDFHHIDDTTKDITPAEMTRQGYSIERMQAEFDKCIPLCANCHRVFHFSTGD